MDLRERAMWTEEPPVESPKGRNMVHVFGKLLERQLTRNEPKEEVR